MTDDKMSHKLPNVYITSPVQYTDREVLKIVYQILCIGDPTENKHFGPNFLNFLSINDF